MKKAEKMVKEVRAMSDNSIKAHLSVDFGMSSEALEKMNRDELIHIYLIRLVWVD